MQQRRPRLGDILDDYCPRERRITNHAVVAMIDDQVKQTRCSTCDADHVYKQGKAPMPRRKKDGAPLGKVTAGTTRSRKVATDSDPTETLPEVAVHGLELVDAPADVPELSTMPDAGSADAAPAVDVVMVDVVPVDVVPVDVASIAAAIEDVVVEDEPEDDGPVHRPLIRATLPRPEGQAPERKNPEFTIRQPGSRGGREFDGNNAGQQRSGRGRRPMRPGQGQGQGQGNGTGQSRFGPPYQGNPPRHGSGQGPRQDGNRPGHSGGGQRGAGRPPGEGGRGPGRKRGR